MEGQAVKEIAALEDKSKIIDVGGRTFARADFKPVIYDPRPGTLIGVTLIGMVDYLRNNREKIDHSRQMLRVKDFANVELVEAFDDEHKSRTIYYQAKLDSNLPVFKFGEYIGVEEFIIKARALFQSTGDLDTIVAIVSRVVAQDEMVLDDNGLSQTVQVKKGVSGALTTDVQTKGVYELRPFRTFRELEQPVSKFILRIKTVENVPKIALFDAEGESWRYEAMLTIRKSLESELLSAKIEIPVIA